MTDAAQWPPPAEPSPDLADEGALEPGHRRPVAPVSPIAPPPAVSAPWQPTVFPGAPGSGWTPPPRPGLVPLRPLGFGSLLGAPFQVLRRSPRTTLGVALLVQGLGSVLALLLYGLVALFAVGRISQAEAADRDAVGAGAVAIVIIAALIPLAVSLATGALVQGVVVLEVSRGVLGERPTLRQLLARLRGRFWALIGWTLLQGAGYLVLVVIAVGLSIPLFLLGAQDAGASAVVGGVIVLILSGVTAAALGVWLSTKLALVPSAMVVERLPLGRAVARSWRLVAGAFWRTFGSLALMAVIIQVAGQVVSTPLSLFGPIVATLLSPTDPEAQLVASAVVALLAVAVGLVIGAVGTVLQSALIGLVHLDRRMRREGFDLVLMQHVEDRAAGRPTPDPFPAPERAPR